MSERFRTARDGRIRSDEERLKMERIFSEEIGQLVVNGHYTLVAVAPEQPVPLRLPADADVESVVAAVQAVALERKALLDRLRAALSADDDAGALAAAREYCNVPKGERRGGKQKVH
jgi:hypothetical protein